MKATTSSEFTQDVLTSSVPVLVDFHAAWCGPCKMMKPEIEKAASQLGNKATIVTVDTDQHPELSTQYGIAGLPSLLVFKNGQIVGRTTGYQNARQIIDLVNRAA